VQLSVADTLVVTAGTGAAQFASAEAVTGPGQLVITGGVFSRTDTVAVHSTCPAEFSAVIVTVVSPIPTVVPAAGD